ncbi:MAG: hypothetical protein AAF596_07645, partial [Planctomycetota bacterium]
MLSRSVSRFCPLRLGGLMTILLAIGCAEHAEVPGEPKSGSATKPMLDPPAPPAAAQSPAAQSPAAKPPAEEPPAAKPPVTPPPFVPVPPTGAAAKEEPAEASAPMPTENETLQADAAAPLIPRDVLFGNPTRAQARLSPDGKWLSFLAPVAVEGSVEGVLNVWVAPADDLAAAEPVTEDTVRGIRSHSWA